MGPCTALPQAFAAIDVHRSAEEQSWGWSALRDHALLGEVPFAVAPELVDPLVDGIVAGSVAADEALRLLDELGFQAPGRRDRAYPDSPSVGTIGALVAERSRARAAALSGLLEHPDAAVRAGAFRFFAQVPLGETSVGSLVAGWWRCEGDEERAGARICAWAQRSFGVSVPEPMADERLGESSRWGRAGVAIGRVWADESFTFQDWVAALTLPVVPRERFAFADGSVALLAARVMAAAALRGGRAAAEACIDAVEAIDRGTIVPGDGVRNVLFTAIGAALFEPVVAKDPDPTVEQLGPLALRAVEKLCPLGARFKGLPKPGELERFLRGAGPLERRIAIGDESAPVWKWLRRLRRQRVERAELARALAEHLNPSELYRVARETTGGVLTGALGPGARSHAAFLVELVGPSVHELRELIDQHARDVADAAENVSGEELGFVRAIQLRLGGLSTSEPADAEMVSIARADAAIAEELFRRLPEDRRLRLVVDWPTPWDDVRWKLAAALRSPRVVEAAAKLVAALERAEDIPPVVLDAVRAQRGAVRPDLDLPPLPRPIESALREALAER